MHCSQLRSPFGRIATLGLFVATSLLSATAHSLELTNIGPITYTRVTGKPFTATQDFPAIAGQGVLCITDADSPNAVVRLNGQQLSLPKPPKHGPNPFQLLVPLAESNVLEVTLLGKPGSSLTVRVTQEIEADGAAVIGPAGGTLVVQSGHWTGAEIRVPAAAVTVPIILRTRTTGDPIDPHAEDPVLELLPHGLQFSTPVTVVLPAERASEGSVQHAYLGAPAWFSLGHNECEAGRLCADLDSFSFIRLFYARLCRWFGESSLWSCKRVSAATPASWTEVQSQHWPILLVHGIQPTEFHRDPIFSLPIGFCGQAGDGAWSDFPKLLYEEPLPPSGPTSGSRFDVWRFDYDHETGINDAARTLGAAVDILQAAANVDQTTIVAHSMGGLVTRQYLAREGGSSRISRLITLGTPHFGSEWARAALFLPGCYTAAKQMLPGSVNEFLRDLNDAGPQTLRGSEPQYVFVAGQDRRPFLFNLCHTYDDDGVVGVKSALSWNQDNPTESIYPEAMRVTLVRLPAHPSVCSRSVR